jgi:SpoIID/LytB domain protein
MCQLGAIGRAEAGHTYRQILSHYYNGATVEQIYVATP